MPGLDYKPYSCLLITDDKGINNQGEKKQQICSFISCSTIDNRNTEQIRNAT